MIIGARYRVYRRDSALLERVPHWHPEHVLLGSIPIRLPAVIALARRHVGTVRYVSAVQINDAPVSGCVPVIVVNKNLCVVKVHWVTGCVVVVDGLSVSIGI